MRELVSQVEGCMSACFHLARVRTTAESCSLGRFLGGLTGFRGALIGFLGGKLTGLRFLEGFDRFEMELGPFLRFLGGGCFWRDLTSLNWNVSGF